MRGDFVELSQQPTVLAVPTPQLEYGRSRAARRFRKRHVLIAALLAASIAGSWIVGRHGRAQAQTLLYVSQAARHIDSADTVVFEPDAQAARGLIAAGTHLPLDDSATPAAVLREPDSFSAFRNALEARPLEAVGALVFLHELTTPSGARRIVAVRFLPHYLDGKFIDDAGLIAQVFDASGLLSEPKLVGRSHARLLTPVADPDPDAATYGEPVSSSSVACLGTTSQVLQETFDPAPSVDADIRWYAGQPDQTDSTHFTIDYEIRGQRGTVDGYLTDDGRHIRMQPRLYADQAAQQVASAVQVGNPSYPAMLRRP